MGKQPKTPKPCAYCGELRIPTRDHLFPECIHAFGLPIDPIIVPACVECANLKSKFDSILRDALSNDVTGSDSPFARRINLEFKNVITPEYVQGPVMRSIKRGRSKFAIAMVKSNPIHKTMKVFSAGTELTVVTSTEANELFQQALEWISRGVFYHFTGRVHSLRSFRCWRAMPCDYETVRANESVFAQQHADLCIVPLDGQGVPTAGYRIGVCVDSDQVMFLTLIFWNCVVFEITTNLPVDIASGEFEPPSRKDSKLLQLI